MRVFLSLPMSGYTDEEIQHSIDWMQEIITESKIFGDEEVQFFHNLGCRPSDSQIAEAKEAPLLYLGSAIIKMANMDAVVFHQAWEDARGCMAESYVAYKYGIPSYYIMPEDYTWTICHTVNKYITDRDGIIFGELDFD